MNVIVNSMKALFMGWLEMIFVIFMLRYSIDWIFWDSLDYYLWNVDDDDNRNVATSTYIDSALEQVSIIQVTVCFYEHYYEKKISRYFSMAHM